MVDKNLAQGVFCVAIGLAFGLGALRYPVGTLAHAGPGFFPATVSFFMGAIGVAMVVRSRFATRTALTFNWKNIGFVAAGLVSFVVMAEHVSTIVGIFLLVFVSALGGTSYSWKRNLIVSAALVGVAFAFQKFLGLNLELY